MNSIELDCRFGVVSGTMEGILTGPLKMLTRVFLFFLTLFCLLALSAQPSENKPASSATTQSDPRPATPDLSQFQDGDPTPKEWGPHIVDHLYKGCPTNSLCSRETGEALDEFKKLLEKKHSLKDLNKFKSLFGVPFEVWGLNSSLDLGGLHAFHWESECSNHNLADLKIYQTGLLIKSLRDFKKLQSDKQIYPRQAYIQDGKNISSMTIMRGDTPLYFDNGLPVFVQEFEGQFYAVMIQKNGDLEIIDQVRPEDMPDHTYCTKELLKAYHAEERPTSLYTSYYCQKIYDIKKKSSMTVLIPKGCN